MNLNEKFVGDCRELFARYPGNRIDVPGIGSTELFEQPIIGFASAEDKLFERYKETEVIGPVFLSPEEWLSGAKTVAAFFFPFSETVRSSNRETSDQPSTLWLYGRIEGQQFLNAYMEELQRQLTGDGIRACVPSLDERFKKSIEQISGKGRDDFHVDSSWSERHAAYACGLGTFGLSRGLITEKGMAGRITSIIIDKEYDPTKRPYTDIYDYCIRCGVCAVRCPAGAISMEYGKNNVVCSSYVNKTKEQYSPRYGCGKCQVGVPCEFRRPDMGR